MLARRSGCLISFFRVQKPSNLIWTLIDPLSGRPTDVPSVIVRVPRRHARPQSRRGTPSRRSPRAICRVSKFWTRQRAANYSRHEASAYRHDSGSQRSRLDRDHNGCHGTMLAGRAGTHDLKANAFRQRGCRTRAIEEVMDLLLSSAMATLASKLNSASNVKEGLRFIWRCLDRHRRSSLVSLGRKSQPSSCRGEIINHRCKPFSGLSRSERVGRLHPFLRQPETAIAIFLIFGGKNGPNGFVSVIRKQIG
jgi:hypothetical protein